MADQPNRKPLRNAGLAAATIAACTLLTPRFEGTVLHTYRDPAIASLITACDGHTGPELHLGMTFTPEQCQQILAGDLQKHWDAMLPCIHVDMTPGEAVAYLDFTFNEGAGTFCRSSMVSELNAGHHAEACHRLQLYNLANHKVMPGLTNRRAVEERICLGA